MDFNVKWAGVSVAYVGMVYGAWRMSTMATNGSIAKAFGIGVGALFGGGMALPFVVTNFVAAGLAAWLGRGQAFAAQFLIFAILSCLFGVGMLRLLDTGLQTMGGLKIDRDGAVQLAGMAAATFAVAMLLMAFAPDRRAV